MILFSKNNFVALNLLQFSQKYVPFLYILLLYVALISLIGTSSLLQKYGCPNF